MIYFIDTLEKFWLQTKNGDDDDGLLPILFVGFWFRANIFQIDLLNLVRVQWRLFEEVFKLK